jgi:tetratricopeptide (TPR) repeat protein
MRRIEWIVLVLLVSVVIVGCKTKSGDEAEPGTAANGETAASQPASSGNPALAEREADVALGASKKQYLVSQFMKFGDSARERGDWAEAQTNYAKVVAIDPGNELAKKRLNEAGAVLGIRPAELHTAMGNAVDERSVRRQAAQSEISDLVAVANRLEKEGNYDGAIRNYQKAQLIVGLYPYYGDFTPNSDQLTDMIAGAGARKVQSDKAARDTELAEARRMKEAEEARARKSKEAEVTKLFRDANMAMQRNQFDLAREYADEILRLDPANAIAAKLRRIANEAKLVTEESATRRNLREQWRRSFEEVKAAAIPQVAPVVFPKDWNEVAAQRKPYQFTRLDAESDPRAQEISNVLATTMVNIAFEETGLQDAVNFLASYANVNIIVLPSVGEEKSEDELLVSLKADNISVASALALITLTKGLSHRIRQGVVQIGTSAEGRGENVLDLYDVKDLTVPIQSFPGEDINLVPSGGFGFGFGDEEDLEPMKQFEGDALADLIRDTIDPEVWDEGGDVTFREGGILVVKAPVDTHKKVQNLLNGLRASGGITVQIETRFITVQDSFLQDIGVDVRGLGDQSNGVGIRGKGEIETFDDVLYGTPANPQGIGTGNETGVFYNLDSDGDVRGRVENLLDTALGRTGLLTASGGASITATYLDDTALEVVLRAVQKSTRSTLVVAPKITAYNGARANVTVLNQVSYIQDFDVEIAQAAQIGDPIVQTLRDGVILDITPIVSSDRKYVTLELRPTVAILNRPIATFTTTLANGPPVTIQLPEINIRRVRTTVTLPDGGILLLGGLKFYQEQRMSTSVPWIDKIPILSFFWSRQGTFIGQRNLVILIKARILVLEEMEPGYGPK